MLTLPLGIRSLEVFDAVFVEDPEPRGDFVDEVVVVGDQQDRAFVALLAVPSLDSETWDSTNPTPHHFLSHIPCSSHTTPDP